MPNIQSIAKNIQKVKFSFFPLFDYLVLHCNIHQNFKRPVLWFPKDIGWIFLDIWNQWTKTNQEMQRAFAKKDFWIFPLKPEPP